MFITFALSILRTSLALELIPSDVIELIEGLGRGRRECRVLTGLGSLRGGRRTWKL